MTEINRRNFLKGALAASAMTAAVGMMGCSPKSGGEEKAAAASAVEDFVQTADTATKKWSFEVAPDPITEDKIARRLRPTWSLLVAVRRASWWQTPLRKKDSGSLLFRPRRRPLRAAARTTQSIAKRWSGRMSTA